VKKKPVKRKRVQLSRKAIKRAWVVGSAGDLKGWMDRFIDELSRVTGIEVTP
jgi:hypothetical protein